MSKLDCRSCLIGDIGSHPSRRHRLNRRAQPPPVVSPEIAANRDVTLRRARAFRRARRARQRRRHPRRADAGRAAARRRAPTASSRSCCRRSPPAPIATASRSTACDERSRATRRRASRTATLGACSTCRARAFMDTQRVAHGSVGRGPLLLDGAQPHAPHARLHAAGLRDATATLIPCSICCTARSTATTRGRRSAARASSSTT